MTLERDLERKSSVLTTLPEYGSTPRPPTPVLPETAGVHTHGSLDRITDRGVCDLPLEDGDLSNLVVPSRGLLELSTLVLGGVLQTLLQKQFFLSIVYRLLHLLQRVCTPAD